MIVGVPSETFPGERRVALVPESVERLVRKGFEVRVQSGTGAATGFGDESYRLAGGKIIGSSEALLGGLDLAIKIHPPTIPEVDALREDSVLICFLFAARNPGLLQRLAARRMTTVALEKLPRTTVAQAVE